MDLMINLINRLSSLINKTCEQLKGVDDKILSQKPAPGKWSKKEIIGHLCDSAVNNLSRFIRAQFESEPFVITRYEQNEWVEKNCYNDLAVNELLDYWRILNMQILHIIKNIPPDKLAVKMDPGDAAFRENNDDKNLLWLIEDYLIHMEHHLKQV